MRKGDNRGMAVNGVLTFDKPKGISSNQAVQKIKRLFRARKVGHTGSLDPLATGILPLCFGEATKFSQYLLNADKQYRVGVRLGMSTDTGDADGKILLIRSTSHVTKELIERKLEQFRGQFDQIPSMYSAIKHHGQPLYKLARQGIEIERTARKVTVYHNNLISLNNDELELDIHCGKGTYVRTVILDLGESLQCGAHVVRLRRTKVGSFTEDGLVTWERLEQAYDEERLQDLLNPVSSVVEPWPWVVLNEIAAYQVLHGQAVIVPHAPANGWVRLCETRSAAEKRFLGIGEILDDGRVAPRRLVYEH